MLPTGKAISGRACGLEEACLFPEQAAESADAFEVAAGKAQVHAAVWAAHERSQAHRALRMRPLWPLWQLRLR